MANGDTAAAQGWTKVAPTDDIRLGYDAINAAADFASTRIRYFTAGSDAQMNALPGVKRGDVCWRSDLAGLEFFSSGTAWKARADASMRCSVWKAGSQALPRVTVTAIGFDSVQSDPTGLMAPNNGYDIRCPWPGRYRAVLHWAFTAPTASYAQSELVLNDGNYTFQLATQTNPADGSPMLNVGEVTAAAGQRIGARVYLDASTDRTFSIGNDAVRPKLDVQYLGLA